MPELALKCIESWHKYMPDWEYILWNEDNFDVSSYQYAQEAYDAKKFAFVSDVARLKALKDYGGLYFDVDFEVYKPFDELLNNVAFAGFEGSKTNPIMMGVLGSVQGGAWVSVQLEQYQNRHFIVNGIPDMTTNVRYVSDLMVKQGFLPNGREQDLSVIHIYPVDYFSPRLTTGEYLRTENTFCEHLGIGSWADLGTGWKSRLLSRVSPSLRVKIIKIKRMIFG